MVASPPVAVSGKCARDTLATWATQQAHVPSDRPFRRDLLLPFPWQHFDTDTQDLAGIEWAPNGCVLAAWDTCLEVGGALLFIRSRLGCRAVDSRSRPPASPLCLVTTSPSGRPSLCRGQSLALRALASRLSSCARRLSGRSANGRPSRLQYKVLLYSLDGRLLAAYCAYEWSLGIKSVAWSPSSQFLAVGSYDGKVGRAPAVGSPRTARVAGVPTQCVSYVGLPQVRILNHVTWKMLTEFGHPAAISDPRVVSPRPSPWGGAGRAVMLRCRSSITRPEAGRPTDSLPGPVFLPTLLLGARRCLALRFPQMARL